eukprot:CAMPEP_0195508826 /NCGR_PEP_ID=MMETSP0794_2-20130614/1934_1 /TAXON_ID=515487 /ORGANISM="Stephanopyxis turris, Strain CCMP 815" /LENGTH=255 /DNA_ID=CAMNT_0040635893 /DNA_START=130 /DNA_END=897 /DNA_ORIENTATION=+
MDPHEQTLAVGLNQSKKRLGTVISQTVLKVLMKAKNRPRLTDSLHTSSSKKLTSRSLKIKKRNKSNQKSAVTIATIPESCELSLDDSRNGSRTRLPIDMKEIDTSYKFSNAVGTRKATQLNSIYSAECMDEERDDEGSDKKSYSDEEKRDRMFGIRGALGYNSSSYSESVASVATGKSSAYSLYSNPSNLTLGEWTELQEEFWGETPTEESSMKDRIDNLEVFVFGRVRKGGFLERLRRLETLRLQSVDEESYCA